MRCTWDRDEQGRIFLKEMDDDARIEDDRGVHLIDRRYRTIRFDPDDEPPASLFDIEGLRNRPNVRRIDDAIAGVNRQAPNALRPR